MTLRLLLVKLAGSARAQRWLQKIVERSQYLMGIGAGADVEASGEMSIFRFLKGRFPPPYTVLDVGANQGQFLNVVRDELSSVEFLLHCFEPGQATFEILRTVAGDDNRVTLNHFGLGREPGRAELHYDKPGSGLASMTKRRLDHVGIDLAFSEEVEIRTVDDYCREHNINRISLLKIDVEGHELDALAGAKEMFERNAIDMVTFEFGGCNIDTKTYFQDFWYFFQDRKMDIFRVTPSGYLFPVLHHDVSDEQFRTTNFIAVRAS